MKKSEINKLDKIWRGKINDRDMARCQFCGESGNNCHHIVGRRNRSTRWLLDNGLLLCPGCHTFSMFSFHQDPAGTMEWFRETYPERYEHIMARRNLILKQTFSDVLEELDG